MRIVAGCDGGGSKCAVVVAVVDGQKIVREGHGVAGPANVSSNVEQAIDNLRIATVAALADADLPNDALMDRFVVGLAGATSFANDAELKRRITDVLSVGEVRVEADANVLFAAANVVGPGIVSIVGTGSIAWARDASGVITRAGGLGPKVGDEGSGYWIGRKALDASLMTLPGEQSVGSVAALASAVFLDNCLQAKEIIDLAAQHIASLLVEATRTFTTSQQHPLVWICGGGVAVNHPHWLAGIRSRCAAKQLFLSEPRMVPRPVIGALRLALGESPSSSLD